MSKIAVAMVHGLGANKPCEMMEDVTAAIHTVCSLSPEVPDRDNPGSTKPDTSRTEIYKREDEQGRESNVYLRDYKVKETGSLLCVAEGYWGDISLIRSGFWNFVWGLVLNLFGLRYFADAALDRNSVLAQLMRAVLNLIVSIIVTITLPLNLFALVFGFLMLHLPGFFLTGEDLQKLYTSADPASSSAWALLMAGFLCGLFSIIVWRGTRKIVKERRLIDNAIYGFGILSFIALISGIASFSEDIRESGDKGVHLFFEKSTKLLTRQVWKDIRKARIVSDDRKCGQKGGVTQERISKNGKALCIYRSGIYIAVLLMAQALIALLTLILALVSLILLGLLWIRRREKPNYASGLFLSVASVFALWLLFGSVLYTIVPADIVAGSALELSLLPKGHSGIQTIYWFEVVPLFLLAGLFVILGSIYVRRGRYASSCRHKNFPMLSPEDWMPRSLDLPPAKKAFPRLIVSKALIGFILLIMMGVLIYIAGTVLFPTSPESFFYSPQFSFKIPVDIPANASVLYLYLYIILLAFIIIMSFLRRGLEITIDVVNHFTSPTDFPFRKREITVDDYPVRKRIANRFEHTIDTLLKEDENPHLVIVAHSQGTIIAYDALCEGLWEKKLKGKVASLTILTFGSPLTHIYQHYFPQHYPKLYEGQGEPRLKSLSEQPNVKWYNVYRIDDYIGTYIHGVTNSFPENMPMSPDGHVKYWQQDIFQELKDKLLVKVRRGI